MHVYKKMSAFNKIGDQPNQACFSPGILIKQACKFSIFQFTKLPFVAHGFP